jgi:integrase
VRLRLKHINTVKRYRVDGSFVVYRYHRKTGQQIHGVPGTPDFLRSYEAAAGAKLKRTDGTLADLIKRFEESPEYADLRDTTRAEYKRKLAVVDKKWGETPLEFLTDMEWKRDVIEWRDGIAVHHRREADNLVSALGRVLSFAYDRGAIDRNILDRIRRVYRNDRSDAIWLPEHVSGFVAVAPVELIRALMLGVHTGQRQGDLLRLPWSAYDGERIKLRQSKTGRHVNIKCTAALKAMLDGMERTGILILTTKTGQAWKKRYFAEQWEKATKAAKIEGLHFHDLRGTAVTMLAEAGATGPEIASLTGHSLKHAESILERYLSRTKPLADAAIFKLENRLQSGENR